jgi:hypothetical protein
LKSGAAVFECLKADTKIFKRRALNFANTNTQHHLLPTGNFHQI